MSIVIGVYSILGMAPHMVQKGLVMSNIVKFREKVVTARHFRAGMYFTAVTQLFATVIVRSCERSCRHERNSMVGKPQTLGLELSKN